MVSTIANKTGENVPILFLIIPFSSAPFPWSLCLWKKRKRERKILLHSGSDFCRAIPGQSLHWQQEEEINPLLMLLSQFAWPS